MTSIGPVWTFNIGAPATQAGVFRVLITHNVEGATIEPALGMWKGTKEKTVQARIAGIDEARAEELGAALRDEFKQEAVYVESQGKAYLV